ncbi:MAG TPA: CHAD domain-containing protein [Polyangiaceae bacterium]|nr:CHAD domain-containing protein [Polyangiaceae bacterium]
MSRPRAQSRTTVAARAVVGSALQTSWERVETELERYRHDPEQAGAHHLRVGMRRFLAAAEFAQLLEPEALQGKLPSRVKHLLGALSPLRDIEIQREALDKHALAPEARQAVTLWLNKHEQKLAKKLQRKMARFPVERTRQGVADAVAALMRADGDSSRSAELALLGRVAERYRSFDRRRRASHDHELHELHRTRVAFKKFRYAVELAAPLLRPVSKQRKEVLKAFQDELGALQDSVVILALFSRRKATHPLAAELRAAQATLATHVRALLDAQTQSRVPAFSEYLP